MKYKNKIYITILIFAAFFIFLAIFFIWPLFSKIKNNASIFAKERNKELLFKKQSEEILNFENENKYQLGMEGIRKKFIEIKNPINFIKFLEEAAKELGLELKISLTQAIEIQILASGKFLDTANFIKKIEASDYAVKIKQINFRKQSQEITNKKLLNKAVSTSILIEPFYE